MADAKTIFVYMVSSLDPSHPADNILDEKDETYWISTGLYPQEIILRVLNPSFISSVRFVCTKVRRIRIEGCRERTPVNFNFLAEREFADSPSGQELQREVLQWHEQVGSILYIRVQILSGWHEFCSVHGLRLLSASGDPVVGRTASNDFADVARTSATASTRGGTIAVETGDERQHQEAQRKQWIEQVNRNGLLLRFAAAFAGEHAVCTAAVLQNADALQFATEERKADRSLVLEAVRQRGGALQWASEELRADREVALVAVSQSGAALQYVAAVLRKDRDVVLTAVRQRGSALRHAARELRGDAEIVEAATASFYFTQEELQRLRDDSTDDDSDDDEDDDA
eukprot:TRINITY_DN34167_c0_g1_i1.p2 TRINITY_DN34167_c0_g1~~TRINITY_DN34167_c0_g1_i1.p2  ORF type:complete len:343 (+),score=73.86 TRINITY_DN34167_c0_g1_i1:213-1241(+)